MFETPTTKSAKLGKSTRLYLRGRTWWCWGFDVDGRKWLESTKQQDKRAAELAAREIARRYALNPERARAAKITVARALETLIEALELKERSPATVRAVEYHGGHLVDVLGSDKPLADTTLHDTTRYLVRRLEQGASRHTVAKELRTLVQAWKRLAKLGQLPPCPDLLPDELGTVYTPRDRWLTREEYEQLRAELAPKRAGVKGGLRHHTQDRRDYLTAYVFAGLRRAELFTYDRARDLDVERRLLHVRGTKTDEADRKVPLAPEAFEVFARRESFPEWHTVCRDLERACKRAKIPPVTPNDLRRTFCSWLCQAGVLERQCAELMGHADTTMVRAVYGHLDLANLAGAIARLSTVTPVANGVAKQQGKRGSERVTEGKATAQKTAKSSRK